MAKFKLSHFIKTLGLHGSIHLLVLVIVIGVIYTALAETTLYRQESTLIESTVTSTSSPQQNSSQSEEKQPTQTSILPTKAASTEKVEVENTQPPTLTKTKTSPPDSPTRTLQENTATPEVCEPPEDWVQYIVQSGDNLYRISLKFRTSVTSLKTANCMGSSTVIVSGQKLWVPNVATSTPIATYTPTNGNSNTPEITPTNTQTLSPTEAPTNTLEPTNTPTETVTPSLTPSITPTESTP